MTAVGDGNVLRSDLPPTPGPQQRRKPIDETSVASSPIVVSGEAFKLLAIGEQFIHSVTKDSLHFGNARGITSSKKPHFGRTGKSAVYILHERQNPRTGGQEISK